MKRNWSPDELAVHWILTDAELHLLPDRVDHNRLGFAAHLKFFELEGRFPTSPRDIPAVALSALATQLHISPTALIHYDWSGRARKNHRAQIRTWFGFRPFTRTDGQALHAWLHREVFPGDANLQHLSDIGLDWCRDQHLEPPTTGRLERLLRSAVQTYEHTLFEATSGRLTRATQQQLDALLQPLEEEAPAEAVPTCSGPQTESLGPTNIPSVRLTFAANGPCFRPTLCANGPTFAAKSPQTSALAHIRCK